jgi:hypothetical protein
MDLAVRPAIK